MISPFIALSCPHPSDDILSLPEKTPWQTSLLAGLAILIAGPALASGPVTYDFEALTHGPLSTNTSPTSPLNQDGWYLNNATSSSVVNIADGTGADSTKVAVASSTRGDAIRNFGHPFFIGLETNAVIQFDFRVGSKYSSGLVAMGGNGSTAALNSNFHGLFSPQIFVGTDTTGTGLLLKLAPKDANGRWSDTPPQQIIPFSSIAGPGGTTAVGHWIQVKLVMNLTANGGDGLGTLYFRNLTIGQTNFTATSIANVSLGLNNNTPGYEAAHWDQVYLRKNNWTAMSAPVAIDNLYIDGSPLITGPFHYDFETLTHGPLSTNTSPTSPLNQDGWYLNNATSSSVVNIADGTGADSTKVAVASSTRGDAIRNFGHPFFTGLETNAVVRFDFRVGSKYSSGLVAMGGNGSTAALNSNFHGLFSPQIFVGTDTTETGLLLKLAPKDANGRWSDTPPQQIIPFSSIAGPGGTTAVGHWIQVKLVMNLTANGGDGLGTLYFRNLTIGQTSFTATSIANVSLGLNNNTPGYEAAHWDQVYLRKNNWTAMSAPVAIDNLYIEGRPLAAGPGWEDFEGQLATREFYIYDYSSGSSVLRLLEFPGFVSLLANRSAQTLQFNESYIPDINNTSDFARIETDPLDPTNKCLFLHAFLPPGQSKGRNELHYSTPYVTDSQLNGVSYTFAFRFYTPVLLEGPVILMQGYSEFPWLRIKALEGKLLLDLAKSGGTAAQNLGAKLDGDNYGDSENPWLGNYKAGSWNTVVVQVVHSNLDSPDPNTGRIEVFVNGNKMVSYIGRTTYFTDSTRIPWMKAGPYGSEASVWYDDVFWQPGLIYPYEEPGFEDGGVYELEPLCAPGKRAEVKGATPGDPNNVQMWSSTDTSRQRWTAQLQSDGSFELISHFETAKRLDVNGSGGSGANVQIWQDTNQPNQRWTVVWCEDGSFELIPRHNTALRLEAADGGNADGTNIRVAAANNSIAQRWKLLRKP